MGSCSVALLYGKYSLCGAGYSGVTGGVKGQSCSVALLYGKYSVWRAGQSGLTGGVRGRVVV